jgi:hypothetical protein
LAGLIPKGKAVEVIFTASFSAIIFVLFYSFISSNGLVLGNDSAVHLNTALYYLNAGKISIGDIAWYTPLYHIVLDTLIAFTGATTFQQMLTLMKALTALVDWLVVMTVYIVAYKFIDRKTGILAATVMLLSFPIFELNSWGGYTSLLSLAFLTLCIMYLALPLKGKGNILVAFILGFSVVLSHQLATFLAVIILAPFLLVVLFKWRGRYGKGLVAVVLGGGIAFGIYYLRPLLPYMDQLVTIVFFQLKIYAYQIPYVTFDAFMGYFGFLLLFAFAGLIMGFFELRKRKLLSFYLLLVLAFVIPLLLTQSYLVGISLPYPRFTYFLTPPLAILAAIPFAYVLEFIFNAYSNHKVGAKRIVLKIAAIVAVAALVAVMVVRFESVSSGIKEDAVFYSFTDNAAYQVGTFINQNFNQYDFGVVTHNPGNWLAQVSNRPMIVKADPLVDLSYNADSVLDLSYEIMHPLSTIKVYDAKTNVTDENFFITNMVWKRATLLQPSDSFVSYREPDGSLMVYPLATMNRSITMDIVNYPKRITVYYQGENVSLTQNFLVQNSSYPVTVQWQITATKHDLHYISLYLCQYMDPIYMWNKANVPGHLNWSNPNENATKADPGNWAITAFNHSSIVENSTIDIYDESDGFGFAIRFMDAPNQGNIGALGNGRIDALRWQYDILQLEANYTMTRIYQMLTFAMDSCPQLTDPQNMDSLFDFKTTEPFQVDCRNFPSTISQNNVRFVVYDIASFDRKILESSWEQLVYSNNEYVVLKIKTDHPYVYIADK